MAPLQPAPMHCAPAPPCWPLSPPARQKVGALMPLLPLPLTLHLTSGVQLRSRRRICERLLQVDGAEETLGELQRVLGLAQ